MVQLVASVAVLLVGLWLVLLVDSAEYRFFGFLLIGIGVLGLAARSWLARQPPRRR